jgi:hypothetical protein
VQLLDYLGKPDVESGSLLNGFKTGKKHIQNVLDGCLFQMDFIFLLIEKDGPLDSEGTASRTYLLKAHGKAREIAAQCPISPSNHFSIPFISPISLQSDRA